MKIPPHFIVSACAGLLWIVVGGVSSALLWNSTLRGMEGVIFPGTIPLSVWAWPTGWTVLFVIVGFLSVAAVHLLLSRFTPTSSSQAALWRAWLATVAAGAAVGFAVDASVFADMFLAIGRIGWSSDLGRLAAVGAYWGLLYGWIPGLIAARFARNHPNDQPASPKARVWLILVAVLALAAVLTTAVFGMRAARVASAQASALAEGVDPADGALPDPLAEGTPVPTVAPEAVETTADWCTPDKAVLLLGGSDAATGHRLQSVQLMNFTDEPCVIEGYPDFAFGDQNGNALDVTIERGSSFMAQDAGATRIEIPAQGTAVANIGWDANATAGALVARSLYAAATAGEVRGSWPIENDIVEGSTVTITAWALPTVGGSSP